MTDKEIQHGLQKALFILGDIPELLYPFDQIKNVMERLREAIFSTPIINSDDFYFWVAQHAFMAQYNTFKSIEILLEQDYYESALILYRNMWEMSLNFHWIEKDFEERVSNFLNFSTVEFSSVMKAWGEKEDVKQYSESIAKFQAPFKYQDSRGKERLRDNFSSQTIHDRAQELGSPWTDEYISAYKLSSMYAHGAPGTIIHAIKQAILGCHEIENNNNSSLVAILAIKLMMRDLHLYSRLQTITVSTETIAVYEEFEQYLHDKRKS